MADVELSVFAPGWRITTDAVLLRFRAEGCGLEPFGSKTSFKKFANSRCAAWHARLVAKIIQQRQFVAGQHDLQPLEAVFCIGLFSISHGAPPATTI